MRIVAIREKTVALSSTVRNASIGFAGMTASALAMVSDVMRHGIPVVGFAFDSVGRYGHGGLLRERFIPRVLAAEPEGYLDEESGGPDPFNIWKIAMRDEKPGGHGERSGAVGLPAFVPVNPANPIRQAILSVNPINPINQIQSNPSNQSVGD